MYIQKRDSTLYIRVCPDFHGLLNELVKQNGISQSDILHEALAQYARERLRKWSDAIGEMCDNVGDTDSSRERTKKAKVRKTPKH